MPPQPPKSTVPHTRLFKFLVLALFSFCLPLQIFAQATYPKIDASFIVNPTIADPFDYSNDVRVLIVQPDASTVSLPAFFTGGKTWRVRHTPTMPGLYSVSNITLNAAPLSFSSLAPSSWTVTGFPTSPGFVRVDPASARHFITSNGRRFFPVGQDVAWSSPTSVIQNIFPKMGAAHETWSRVWMTHFYDDGVNFGLNLDWPKVNNTFGQLSLTNSLHWDSIVAAADQAGIHFQMTLQHHGQYSSTTISDVDPNWEQNPYNTANGGFLSSATNFFTDPMARNLTKRKLRYAVARWGYSPAIMAWELFNEVQFTDAAAVNQWANIEAWHNEMAAFLRSQDHYQHLITTSSDLTQPIWDSTDYYTHHDYPSDLIAGIQDAQDISPSQPVAPDYSAECGIDTTPHVGISPPIWSGLMAAQSGDAMPWYWDTIDPNNDYFLVQAAADFVTVSGLADENTLTRSEPLVSGGSNGPLAFAFGGGFNAATLDTFTVGSATPDGVGTTPPYLQGTYHRSFTPNGYTFHVNYSQTGTFTVQITTIAQSGAGFQMLLDGNLKTNLSFPATSSDTPTNLNISLAVTAGAHTINLTNPGLDWVLLGNITLNPYAPPIAAYAIGTNNWQALWLWNRTNVFGATATQSLTGTVSVAGLNPGTYSGTWWDTFGAGVISNFTFTVSSSNVPANLATPPIFRSTALFVGLPAQATITAPNLAQSVISNSPPFILPLVITNKGGLPLAYSLTFTNPIPAWLTFSSTNGYVSKTSAQTVSLAFNPAGLAVGTYHFTLFANTSDPLLPVTALPIAFTISSGIPTAPHLTFLSEIYQPVCFPTARRHQFSLHRPDFLESHDTGSPIPTNTLTNGPLNFTNPISPAAPQQFYRALWHP